MQLEKSKIIAELEKELKKQHRKYSIYFKIKAIELSIMNISIHSISNRFGLYRKIIRDWIKNGNNLNNIYNKDKRYLTYKSCGIIKVFSDEEEEKIFVWIKEKRDNKLPVSTKRILAYSCSLKSVFSNKKIDAQINLVYRFIKRYALFN